MAVTWLPDSNLRVLECLGVYRFITVPQLQRLGIAKHKPSVYRILRRFQTFPRQLIEKKDFGFIAGVGNLDSVYYLTKRGAALLAEVQRVDLATIKYPKGVQVFQNDYFHRVATIDVHIACRQWAASTGAIVDVFDTYYDKTGSNRKRSGDKLRAQTRVDLSDGFFVPDAIILYTKDDGRRRLAAVEVHNGRDTGRFMKQMAKHIQALEEGAVSDKYGVQFGNEILWVFEHESTMYAAIRRMKERRDLMGFRDYISFNTIENVRTGFARNWRRF